MQKKPEFIAKAKKKTLKKREKYCHFRMLDFSSFIPELKNCSIFLRFLDNFNAWEIFSNAILKLGSLELCPFFSPPFMPALCCIENKDTKEFTKKKG